MPKHKLRITQVLRIERATEIEIEAESVEEAAEKWEEGDIELPPADDPRWSTVREDLENEEWKPVA